MSNWKLKERPKYSRAGRRVSREVHTRHSVPRSFYRHRVTLFKKGMIKYKFSGSGTKLDFTSPWMPAPVKWRRSHRKKGRKR